MKNSSAYWNLSQPRQVKANKRVPLPHQCVLLLKAATSVVLPDFLTLNTFLFLFSLALAEVRMGRCVCVHLPPVLLPQPPGIHRAKPAPSPTNSLCWAEKRKVVPGWLQPCHVPLPLISGERIKCHLLGVGTGCVRPERQQWKRGGREAGNRQRNWTTFLRASKHVVCLGSRQSLFGGCIVSCGNWLRPKPSPGSSSCTFCSQLLRMDPN